MDIWNFRILTALGELHLTIDQADFLKKWICWNLGTQKWL